MQMQANRHDGVSCADADGPIGTGGPLLYTVCCGQSVSQSSDIHRRTLASASKGC